MRAHTPTCILAYTQHGATLEIKGLCAILHKLVELLLLHVTLADHLPCALQAEVNEGRVETRGSASLAQGCVHGVRE